ncbi:MULTISPECIES: ATP-binding protein [unclassified Pseudomonas]|uniref:ATP-binding protein n=2 Tax=Pseudomonas TaxID=286 RepID=UPI000B505487|nr:MULTISPECIES: ATP-binding protein [unclassified Pseudomonas]TFA90798.1 signal transduction histidine kinase [Pseudomonas sp. URIL14HWK12:I1]SNB61559.1 Signal transduction histidine kinase [Pseudomonas sp. LAIL14HWK12:I4]
MTQLKVRARAVDMLGRQQIAGIPTAIHELFKNAHDAYAERVEVDFFRRTRVLVLRDDGYGMTRHDLENRWLTLGTESRVNANRPEAVEDSVDKSAAKKKVDEWRGPKNLPRRVIMGEKGIGRLAIAVIAPITLLMTRASRPDGLKNLVVALVHWGIFEQPGIDISSIDIPVKEFPGGTLPTKVDVGELVDKVLENLENLKLEIPVGVYSQLLNDLERARAIDPDKLDDSLNKGREIPLTLKGDGYGTHFIVLPVAPELDDDIDGSSDKESSKLQRFLLGFSNTMGAVKPVIKTEFRDHHILEVENLIGRDNFFTAKEFDKTDHLFDGKFDEYGQFVGTVSIYGKARKFVCNWLDGKGRQPRCGSFSIRYGYVQGSQRDSALSPEDWVEMTAKTERIGGLYLYRDGIRVLPYGNSDYDFLEIEKRRTKSAQDWFFSYRRGFGYISISHANNSSLTEKAGREGFRENLAYRDFRSVLIGFFQQLALEFFRPNSPQGDDYRDKRQELYIQAELLRKQKNKANARRSELDEALTQFSNDYESGFYEAESQKLIELLIEQLDDIKSDPDPGRFAEKLRLIELDIRGQVKRLFNKSVVVRPRGLALTARLEKDWVAYEHMSAEVRESILNPLRDRVDESLSSAMVGRLDHAQRREVALQDIVLERDSAVKELVSLRRDALQASEKMQQSLKTVLQEEFSEVRANMEALVTEFARRSAEKPDELDRVRHEIERDILALQKREVELLASFKRQMVELSEGINERETLDDRFAALESRNQVLEEQLEFYSDFAQMGMSVGVLQHEFERAARGIRVTMGDLKPWADRNPPLASIYKQLREHIEHLDGYLKVLDPLGRRMHRATIELSGDEILNALRRIFSDHLKSARIELIASSEFRAKTVECKSSALLGAFINIVDNAIYWVASRAEGKRQIILDADRFGFLVSNTGPGIEKRLKDRIFDFGETSKPGGRGMGLAISRDTLRRENFDLELLEAGSDVNPVFRIKPKDEQVIV